MEELLMKLELLANEKEIEWQFGMPGTCYKDKVEFHLNLWNGDWEKGFSAQLGLNRSGDSYIVKMLEEAIEWINRIDMSEWDLDSIGGKK